MRKIFLPKVSIIIPCYKEKNTLEKTINLALNQKYKNKEVIVVGDNPSEEVLEIVKRYDGKLKFILNQKNLGLAGSLNRGIKISRGEIIVTLLADCWPASANWLDSLVANFDNPFVVGVSSKVENPKTVFQKMDPLVKDMLFEEYGVYSPALDEKGCAYRRSALLKVGLFDSNHFKTAGEDFDMTIKLSKIGKIVIGNEPRVIHIHPMDLKQVYSRWASYARGFGVIVRIYGKNTPGFKGGLLRTFFPVWGVLKGIKNPARYSKRKIKLILVYLKMNLIYLINFIMAFILKKQ